MMPDIEKVISEFEDFVKSFSRRDDTYYKGLSVSVLAMLKRYEAVEPKTEPSAKGYWYTCGVCGWRLFEVRDTVHFDDRKRIHFCASCGRSVKWDA